MTDAEQLRAALEHVDISNFLGQIEQFRKTAEWSKERLDAAFTDLRTQRESNPMRSHSIEDWLKEVVKQNEMKRTADSSPAAACKLCAAFAASDLSTAAERGLDGNDRRF
jgi:hypothetical protein